MLTAKQVKTAAMSMGADLVGIASLGRFEGAPKQEDPRYIFPDAKALIALGFRLPRGYFRGIEEGTYFTAYPAMGYGGMNKIYMPIVQRELCCFIEDHGYEAAPIPNMYPGTSIPFAKQAFDPTRSRPVAPDLPHPDILVNFRIAAFAAGLGEIGYSKLLLTPEFGPRQRIVLMMTDAPLEPDPIYEGPKLCDRCMRCVVECSGEAISPKETDSVIVAGHKLEWGHLDVIKCSIGYCGGNPDYNPFMRPGADPSTYAGKYTGKPGLPEVVGYPTVYGHNPALEGARGCIRACMIHLDERGVLKNKFENPFRRHKPWKMGPLPPA
jgi:hypothetical protein